MGRKALYTDDEQRKAAARRRTYLRDLPRQMHRARRHYHHLIATIKREGLTQHLTEEENNYQLDMTSPFDD